MILDRNINVYQLQSDSDNSDKEQYSLNLALVSIPANLQPSSPQDALITDGVYSQSYTMFTSCSGIQTGDKIVVSGENTEFIVRGTEDWSLPDLISHYKFVIQKQ